jgi:hypothetical protein
MPQIKIIIGGQPHSIIKFYPAPIPEVILHKSHDACVSLPAPIDNGMVGDIQSWQCPICSALLQRQAGQTGGTVSCPICGSHLQAPVAPAKQSTCASNVLLAAALRQVKQLKAQLFGVEVFDVDTEETEQVVRKDVEPVPNRLKRQTEQVVREKKQVVRIKREKAAVAEELGDTQDDYQKQITFTDTLQTKLDEMSELALASGASLLQVNKIKRLA